MLASPSALGSASDSLGFKVVTLKQDLAKDGRIRKRLDRPELHVTSVEAVSNAVFEVIHDDSPGMEYSTVASVEKVTRWRAVF